ncbi:MAG: serine/threonine-protein kinase RsbW [Clostridiales bacterium]|jgi:serine/threonine-protein kinase RsbW|nr:serine/threonine-protein kinase RsbW [Clostridiales bacterium]MDN5282834.1 serine/threonine-protein kinase RsbW [Candidatus Ozemobacter sp.]
MRRFPEQVVLRFRNPQYINIVRDNTEMIARRMGFNEDKIFELTMAVDEAYTNAIEHSGGGSDLNLEVEFLIFEDRLEISVSDTGCGFDLSCFNIPETLKHLKTVRGRGLSLIKQLSDHFELDSMPGNGTLIKIIKFISSRRLKKSCIRGV